MNRVDQHPVQAFAVALAAVATLSVMDAVMKGLVIAIGIFAVSVWRSLVNLLITGTLYLPRRLPWPSQATLRIHVIRSVVVALMAFLFFWGIGRVPLAQGIALTFIAPLIALLLAASFLGERVAGRSIGGSVIAFAGVLVIVVGQARADLGADVLWGTGAVIASAICYAANIVLMRTQAMAAKPLEINFFQSLIIAIIWVAAIPFMGMPQLPKGHLGWIVVAGLMSTTGGLLFAWAYARAEASYLAVTEYSAFLWAAALGWIVFREPVSLYTIAGAGLIVGGCLLAARARSKVPGEVEVAT
jgi:S-adenosylmethionine uptake transporter